jgi:hypothetical protein
MSPNRGNHNGQSVQSTGSARPLEMIGMGYQKAAAYALTDIGHIAYNYGNIGKSPERVKAERTRTIRAA